MRAPERVHRAAANVTSRYLLPPNRCKRDGGYRHYVSHNMAAVDGYMDGWKLALSLQTFYLRVKLQIASSSVDEAAFSA